MTILGRIRGAVKSFLYSGFRRDRWQQPGRVVELLALEEGECVADLGAGGGYFTYRLARAVGPEGRVYAVDPDRDMRARIAARAARKSYKNIVPVDPGRDGPDLPEAVDAVLTVNAFHHLPDDRARYFRGLAENLRPGARVAVIEALPRWFLFGHATSPGEIRSVMQDAGYRVVAEPDFLDRQSFTLFERESGV